jgi:hypothetical protein
LSFGRYLFEGVFLNTQTSFFTQVEAHLIADHPYIGMFLFNPDGSYVISACNIMLHSEINEQSVIDLENILNEAIGYQKSSGLLEPENALGIVTYAPDLDTAEMISLVTNNRLKLDIENVLFVLSTDHVLWREKIRDEFGVYDNTPGENIFEN